MRDIVNKVKTEYGEFAEGSNLEVKNEGGGYRLTETTKNGDVGVMLFFKDDELCAFNNGWKLEQRDPNYLGDACDKLIGILNKHNIPIGVLGTEIKYKSKSYR